MYTKYFDTCKCFKKRNTCNEFLPTNNASELKLISTAHIDLIALYTNSIRQQHLVGTIIHKDVSLTLMTIIDPMKLWFEIVKVPCFDLYKVVDGSNEYIDK